MTDQDDVRAETASYRIKAECFDWDGSFNAERAYHIIHAALAQFDAEPVRDLHEERMDCYQFGNAPPNPDTAEGLIEAAEIAEEWADATSSLIEANLFRRFARYIRARAADRSGKV